MTLPDPAPPPRSRYASKLERRQREFAPADTLPLDPQQSQPLPIAPQLESKNNHGSNVAGWKHLFKPGDEFVLHGVTFVFDGTGKRCLHLRPKRSV